MQLSADQIWQDLEEIKDRAPVIHNITNFVVMNTTANALLAIGASPVMAHAEEEVEEMVGIADALVINIGTLSRHLVPSMVRALVAAAEKKIPIVLDPVGAGATNYRTKTTRELLETAKISIVRGNASEIIALTEDNKKTRGVDATALPEEALISAKKLGERFGSVVCISGEIDYILFDGDLTKVKNGHVMMPRVTGLGCTASALCAAFAAVNSNYAQAAVEAMAVMGIAGELAAMKSPGPGSMQVNFIDTLFRVTKSEIEKLLRIEG